MQCTKHTDDKNDTETMSDVPHKLCNGDKLCKGKKWSEKKVSCVKKPTKL